MNDDKSGNPGDLIDVLKHVRQIRQFTDQPVPQDIIDDILEVARWTGSGMNSQPWEFVLIRDPDTLRQVAQEEGKAAHLAGADFAIVLLMAGEGDVIETFDEGRLTERLLIAANARGIGAGIWWFKDGGAAARRILGIPEKFHLRTAVSFGYPAPNRPPARNGGRKPIAELVHQGKY